jgi:hypothetical protein
LGVTVTEYRCFQSMVAAEARLLELARGSVFAAERYETPFGACDPYGVVVLYSANSPPDGSWRQGCLGRRNSWHLTSAKRILPYAWDFAP